MWHGSLNDELIDSAGGPVDWITAQVTPKGRLPAQQVKTKVAIAVNSRPLDFPAGPEAIRRQLGVEEICHPTKNKNQKTQAVPRRGDIWPADVDNIALSPGGTTSTYVGSVSMEAHSYLSNYKTRMLRDD